MLPRFHSILDAFPDIVTSIDDLEILQKETIIKLKAKLRLFDGSILWVREIHDDKGMKAYSYYWLRPDETMIMGWDNAPHHKNVKNHPHHRHIAGVVEDSIERNLFDVLHFIKSLFENATGDKG